MEALWQPTAVEVAQDVLPFFRIALADPNHRVVANALVGLYRLGETEALQKMIVHCSDGQHLFRAAMAWAMGVIDDTRAVPTLKNLSVDRSFTVRQRASSSLLSLGFP
jgi:HEAT repeat protein